MLQNTFARVPASLSLLREKEFLMHKTFDLHLIGDYLQQMTADLQQTGKGGYAAGRAAVSHAGSPLPRRAQRPSLG